MPAHRTIEVNWLRPNADGQRLIEAWASYSQDRWLDRQGAPALLEEVPQTSYWTRIIPDDGVMGGPFLRIGHDDPATKADAAEAFGLKGLAHFYDPDDDIRVEYRFRANWSPVRPSGNNANSVGAGPGVLYSGECSYEGCWTEYPTTTDPVAEPNEIGWGLYDIQARLAPGDLVDCILDWLPNAPAGRTMRLQYRRNGGDWQTIEKIARATYLNDDTPTDVSPNWLYLSMPVTWYFYPFGGMDYLPVGYTDLGPIKITGKPLAGAVDFVGFAAWQFDDKACFFGGADHSGNPGGATIRPGIGYGPSLRPYKYIDWVYGWYLPTSTRLNVTGRAKSPAYKPQRGYRYRDLTFAVFSGWTSYSNVPNGHGYVKVYVRNAATDELLPDDQVPGNSQGLVNAPQVHPGVWCPKYGTTGPTPMAATEAINGQQNLLRAYAMLGAYSATYGPQRVSLQAVPLGVDVYLDVELKQDGATGGNVQWDGRYATRLSYAFFGYESYLSVDSLPVNNGVIGGTREIDQPVSLSVEPAPTLLGEVTYPTSETWEASVTGLDPDATVSATSNGATAFPGEDPLPPTPDATPPTIDSFAVPASPLAQADAACTIVASDDVAATGYAITVDSLDAPTVWQPTGAITVALAEGTHTLRAYARDAAGNVSDPYLATITVALPPAEPQGPAGVTLMRGNTPATLMRGTTPISIKKGTIL